MKDQHYSMKDPSDWTKEDWEMYKRDESRTEYTEEQIKQIENELDYEQHMKDKTMTTFKELNEINVNEHTEKKNKYTYLSLINQETSCHICLVCRLIHLLQY